jgi:[protein-PII] uridylyltransferase
VEPAVRIERLRADLAVLDRAYSPGHHGLWSATRRAGLVDAALIDLFERAAPTGTMAIAAVGGFGRGILLPGSDIDLLLMHDGADPAGVAAVADALLYPLWDAGFRVGHAVRTPAEASDAVAAQLETLTASLDARFLAGDPALVTAANDAAVGAAGVPSAFAERLSAAAAERRARHGSAATTLEPDLKEGAGGLREIDALAWLQRVAGSSLEDAGLLRPRERTLVVDAREFLTRVRSAMHLLAPTPTERLVLDLQPDLAAAMGFADEPGWIAVDGLMRAVFEHARQVRWIHDTVMTRAIDGTSSRPIPNVDPNQMDAEQVLAAFADLAESGEAATLELLEAAEGVTMPELVSWTDAMVGALLRILRSGDGGAWALETLDRLGKLTAYLPAWRDVRCRPQRDPYHRFAVDTHLMRVVAGAARAVSTPDPEDPVEQEAVGQIEDPDGLLLGALLHDIGKNGEGGHVAVGSRVAAEALAAIPLPEPTRELALFVVRQHLLLPDTATRRDLGDEDLILEVAATIGTTDRLACLYVLAKADAEATGPAAWTPWRQTLIRELVAKVQGIFDRGQMGRELADRLAERIDRVRQALEDHPAPEVERFVLRMPQGYLLGFEPERIARHYPTIAPEVGIQEVRTAAAPGSRPGTHELLVVAADRPGLLSWIAGALSLAGLSIRTAHVFTTDDRVAVDLFEVAGTFEPEIGEERWRRFRSILRKAIEGRTSLERRVSETRRHYPAPAAGVPVTVTVDNWASDFFTVIEVGAADRIGLLYDVTRTLAELNLNVHLATVSTYEGRVVDAFYVRDAVGRKFEDPRGASDLESALRARLGGEADGAVTSERAAPPAASPSSARRPRPRA